MIGRVLSRIFGQLPILAKMGVFLFVCFFVFVLKKGNQKFHHPLFNPIPFLSVLHQNKALNNFHKREQRQTAGRIKVIDYELMGHPTCLVLRLE